MRVLLLDMMAAPGGRVWAGAAAESRRDRLVAQLAARGVSRLQQTRVVAAAAGHLLVERHDEPAEAQPLWIAYEQLLLCTGARELQLPFAGWTLPGVVAAGGLQLMIKSGLSLAGRRVVVAGTGPLLLAAAASARRAGAQVLCVAEQAPAQRLRRFVWQLCRHPGRLWQAAALRTALATTAYRCSWRLQRALADGGGWVNGVVLLDAAGREHMLPCDLLAVGHSLTPELELATLLGCRLRREAGLPCGVCIDEFGATSMSGIYAAGESTGVGGQHKALLEGRVAGLAVAGRVDAARRLLPRLARERRYALALHEAFFPRRAESPQPSPDTLVCRCEDVPWSALAGCGSWREARLQQRCGMGHCQGRGCGPALALHKGWTQADERAPLLPASVATLARLAPID
jgi:NADPH-dependent 2,4-dienoyl-CoA reductase/sulfur reductase-like enzyme